MSQAEAYEKLDKLKTMLKDLGKVAIAFSGGVDSTFLLKVASEVLGDNVIAVTARSSTYPEREYREACQYAKEFGVKHIVIESEELEIEGFAENPVNRCYFCKNELFTKVLEVGLQYGIPHVLDGCNRDDLGDYRPGMQAAREIGVHSPLKEIGMTKDDIRLLSRDMGLATWDKQAFACLSSRFPYHQKITKEKLEMVDKAEQYLLDLGFRNVRVRHHGDIARIEVATHEREKFFTTEMMDQVAARFKEIGFTYTALDLRGYRTGSMNEGLKKE
ncbi:MAG: ATP-dependent sacrificial sulfur transferase LarE [Clostridia bacterium]|nr:ATP-dependent sacrificial sulfur transferase LarE [Clostridia bacterium]